MKYVKFTPIVARHFCIFVDVITNYNQKVSNSYCSRISAAKVPIKFYLYFYVVT